MSSQRRATLDTIEELERELEALAEHEKDIQSLPARYQDLNVIIPTALWYADMYQLNIGFPITDNNISASQTERVKSLTRHLLRHTTPSLKILNIDLTPPCSPLLPSKKQLQTQLISTIGQEISAFLTDSNIEQKNRGLREIILYAEGTNNEEDMFAGQDMYFLTPDEEKRAGMSVTPWENDGEEGVRHARRSGIAWRRM